MRPSCNACGGLMLPEYDHNDRVESVKCTSCGRRLWREFSVRRPTAKERNTQISGANHNQKGRDNHA